jgi:hypothetical protein
MRIVRLRQFEKPHSTALPHCRTRGRWIVIEGIERVDLLAMIEADGVELRKCAANEFSGACVLPHTEGVGEDV